ncbi:hypothetical protein BD26P3_00015 [Phocaeicola phage BD26P3]|nr:hypothetical protein BD26P1_00022 [Phocaeicola phage BD26P1]WAX06054.1 hypothetical protein BD26P2_00007 [Phocaeicola phage BD26P2]WAX06111.1 hypothetical protein BD26P3_00015 [Phocaeicola phage BD26P3]WAX06151.1 hypothetical protein BD26P4_00007 [Phocaeicola phage BD26P4]WAX06208.1 hypothetical protein BD26P5_00015 [Phocaeicola phage BD26P5]
MACLQKFNVDLSWGCSSGTRWSTLGKYTEAILINASDISSFSGGGNNATLVLASGQKGAVIGVINNSFKVSVARKGGDMFPVMYDPSVTMKVPDDLFSTGEGAAHNLVNSDFVIALKGSNGYTIFGLGAPLVCTEIEGDSTASEYLTVTFGTDEGQTGSTIYGISKATYEALKVPAV